MKKTLKAISVFLVVLLALSATVFGYNRIMLASEESLLREPVGQYVEVDGHRMNIYTEGEGEHTLLFLAGSGTAAPVLNFKCLYSLLSNDYRIVVIEKFGYGFSDVVDTERSFKTILRQDREALAKAGIEGPFVLCPHSMSGLEAIMWTQEYPEEVEAIAGLDMVVPGSYDGYDFEGTVRFEKLAALGREMGIIRFYYADSFLPEGLSREDKELCRAIACRSAVNDDVIKETEAVSDAVKQIESKPKPDIPMLMFVSDGTGTGIENWAGAPHAYAQGLSNVKLIDLGCSHEVHNIEQERIAGEIRAFLNNA